jgi:hypothetical protein
MNKRTLYISLYLSLLFICYALKTQNFELSITENFVIGEATSKGISIGKRITQFYSFILMGGIIFITLYYIFKRFTNQLANNQLIHLVDSLIPFGCLLLGLSLFEPKLIESGQLIGFFAFLIFIFGFIKKLNISLLSDNTWLVIGLCFTANFLLFHSALKGGFFALLLLLLIQIYSFEKLVIRWISGFLISLPIIVVLGVETTLILNQRAIFIPSYWIFGGLWSVIFGLFLVVLVRKEKNKSERYIYSCLAFLAIISVGLAQTYSPQIYQVEEMFENANMLNPVMQFHHFGEIPIIHNLSSHLVSDFFWEFLYYTLNGYQENTGMTLYGGFGYILIYLSLYFFLRTFFGNKPAILVGLFLFPAITFILPFYFALFLIPASFLLLYSKEKKQKHFHYFLLSILLISIWRLDLGISLIAATLMMIPFWFIWQKEDRRLLLKWIAISILSIGTVAYLFVRNFPEQFHQMTGYFGANQAHGRSVLTYDESNIYFLHYFLLPFLVLFVLVHTIISYKNSTDKPIQFTLLFFGLFYLFNLQRGLVRHSFTELTDTQISSLVWIILILKIWSFIRLKYSKTFTIHFGALALSLLPLFLSVQKNNGTLNIFRRDLSLNLKEIPKLTDTVINRVLTNPQFDQRNKEIIQFLRTQLNSKQTFIDFSNTPMLYFYSGKNVPSYFNQYLQNTVTDKLQLINLEELKKVDAPFIVFSQFPEGFFDNIDYIPNKVRHHLITQYIYTNYEPYTQMGGYRLWKRKNWTCSETVADYPSYSENWDLGLIPYYWKFAKKHTSFKDILQTSKLHYDSKKLFLTWENPIKENWFIQFLIYSPVKQDCKLLSNKLSINFTLLEGKHTYLIPINCSENIHENRLDTLTVNTSQHPLRLINSKFVRLEVNEN